MGKTRKVGNLPKKVANRKLHTDLTTINNTIIQASRRTKDSFYSLTDLCNAYNELNGTNKLVSNYLRQKSTKELIKELENDLGLSYANSHNSVVRINNRYGTWGHGLLWLDFAMWLSPKFKVSCLKLLRDHVIEIRLDTISNHKELQMLLNEKLNVSVGQWISLQQDINMCAYGCERNEVRQIRDRKANEEELKRLELLQNTIEQMVDCGVATEYRDIQKYLKNFHRKQWGRELYKKDRKSILSTEDYPKQGELSEELKDLIGY